MDEKFVVTIARQFGSLGRPIARKVSEKLAEESAKSAFFNMNYPLGMGTTAIQDSIFASQRKIIVNLAEKESCIIVGRCADHILRDCKNIINIFIYAPYEARLVNCVERLDMRLDEAKRMIASVDKARESYHRHYSGYSMSDKDYKHVMLDSSLLGVDGTCDILTDIIKKRFNL